MKKKEKLIIGIITVVLVSLITVQLRTMRYNTSAIIPSFANEKLKDNLLQWKQKYEMTKSELEEINKSLEKIRIASTQRDEKSKDKTEELKRDNVLLGMTDVSGTGIVIKARDGKPTVATDDIGKFLVHDGDIREIIAELFNAGAEAISVNGERVVNSTYILCAGNIITVNGEKISSPFVINAIGNSETLYGAILRPGGYVQYMKESGVPVEIKKVQNIYVKKYNGVLTQKYMKIK